MDDIDKWTNSSYNGLNFRNDLDATFELDGDILVVFNRDKPAGFLAYSQTLIPTVWGAVDSNINDYNLQKEIMESLILEFGELNGFEDVIIQVNSRYNVLVDILFKWDLDFEEVLIGCIIRVLKEMGLNKAISY